MFSGRDKPSSGDKFECGQWSTLKSDAPALKGALVSFDCTVKKSFLHGTHWVFVGELNDIAVNDGRSSLIYANRAYGRLALM